MLRKYWDLSPIEKSRLTDDTLNEAPKDFLEDIKGQHLTYSQFIEWCVKHKLLKKVTVPDILLGLKLRKFAVESEVPYLNGNRQVRRYITIIDYGMGAYATGTHGAYSPYTHIMVPYQEDYYTLLYRHQNWIQKNFSKNFKLQEERQQQDARYQKLKEKYSPVVRKFEEKIEQDINNLRPVQKRKKAERKAWNQVEKAQAQRVQALRIIKRYERKISLDNQNLKYKTANYFSRANILAKLIQLTALFEAGYPDRYESIMDTRFHRSYKSGKSRYLKLCTDLYNAKKDLDCCALPTKIQEAVDKLYKSHHLYGEALAVHQQAQAKYDNYVDKRWQNWWIEAAEGMANLLENPSVLNL